MNYKWRKKAQAQLKRNATYCTQRFGKSIALHFIDKIDHQVELLATHPHLGIVEPLLDNRRRTYRSLVVHEHFKLVYYIDEKQQTLYIVALWDTRCEPARLSQQIISK